MEKAIGYVKIFIKQELSNLLPGQIKQKNEIKKYCQENYIDLEKIIVEKVLDDKSETPLFNELIYKKNDENQISKVVVFKSSIISIDQRYYLYCCFSLARREIELVSVKEDYTKQNKITPRDKNLVYAMAFFEKKRMGYLLKEGRAQKRMSSEYIPGASPYGYKKINGQYIIDISEAEVVKLIFKMKEKNGKSLTYIANFLNRNCIKTRQGKEWRSGTIKNILKNKKIYQGYVFYPSLNSFKRGRHDPIL